MGKSSAHNAEIAGLAARGYRRCSGCEATKPLADFHAGKCMGGVASKCKACVLAYTKEWASRADVRERQKQQYEARYASLDREVRLKSRRVRGLPLWGAGPDAEKLRAKRRRWYERHGDAKRARESADRAANPGKYRLRGRAWKAANPEKHASQRHRRNERIRATADGTVTRERVMALFASARKCPYCGARLTDNTKSLDHVVALARGGRHTLSNLTVCCHGCNVRKGAKAVALL